MEDRPLIVSGAIIMEGGRALLAKRHQGARFEPNRWEFPGGKVEYGEHPKEALRRELAEELGIEVEVGKVYDVVSHVYQKGGRHVVIVFYLCRIVNGSPAPMDCQDVLWHTKGELQKADMVEGDRELVQRIAADPGLWTSS